MKKLITFIVLLLIGLNSYSIDYYVSPAGNDNNNGTSISTPWQTISKVNSVGSRLKAGDKILFQRGGVYRGSLSINANSLGTISNPILITTYGTGANPVFLGSINPNNWTVHQGNIWKTTSSKPVNFVFQNDQLLTLARYPNNGWLRNDNGSATQIQDSELNQSNGYWNNARLVVRSSAWSYHVTNISNYTSGVLNFTSIGGYNLSNRQWGYFLCNKLSELDSPGEWFFDSATSTIYVWPLNNINPNNNIELAVENYGLRINTNVQYCYALNIDFKYYIDRALIISSSNNSITNCNILKSNKGLTIFGNNNLIQNNTFKDIYATALFVTQGNTNTISNNNFENIAIIPGLGESGWGYFAIRIAGSGNRVELNTLNKIGYIAIVFAGNTIVEKNKIENACFTLSDGGAIAFDETDGASVQNNIILYTLGNIESCAPNYTGCDPKGKGIYFGNISNKNNTVSNNTVAYCNGPGIWVDHTMVQTGNRVTNNNLYSNLYQIGFSDYSNYNGPGATQPYAVASYIGTYSGNICYSTSVDQKASLHINRWFSGVDFGTFNDNYYYGPNTSIFELENFLPSYTKTTFNLSQWKQRIPDETNSVQGNSSESILVFNDKTTAQNINLNGAWSNVRGTIYTNSINLQPFSSEILFKVNSVPSCSFNYSNWSACINNKQTRTFTSSPSGCVGTPPVDSLSRNCTISCSFTYNGWSACTNGKQTRTFTSSPSGCVGTPPVDSLSRNCTVVPTCVFVYSKWTDCCNGKQVRAFIATPSTCIPPQDSISRNCNVTPPPCNFIYSNWSNCSNGIQTRTYTSSPLGCVGIPPVDSLSRSCTIVSPTGKKALVVVNTNDPVSSSLATAYMNAWNLGPEYKFEISIGSSDVITSSSVVTNASNAVKNKANQLGVKDVVLTWTVPTKISLWNDLTNKCQSITSGIAVGPRDPSLYTINNMYQNTNGTIYPVLLWSTEQIKASQNKTNPQGKFAIIVSKDQTTPLRGNILAALSTNVKGRSDVLYVDNRQDTRLSGGNNPYNNLSDMLFTLKNKVPAPSCCPNIGPEPDIVGYFVAMFELCCPSDQNYINGWGAASVTSFSGEVGNVSNQTDFTFFSNKNGRNSGAAWTGGPVSEPWSNLNDQFISPNLFIPYVKDQGVSYGRAMWASVRMADRFLFVGDPLCAPWEK